MLLTDSDRAIRQWPRHIGKLVGIVGRIAVAVVADGIDDELFRNAFIIVEAVECCGIVLWAVMLQLGQTKADEIPNSTVESANVVKICFITADVLFVITPCVLGRTDGTKHFVIKGIAFF